MYVHTLKGTTVGEREFELTVQREGGRVRYGVRAVDLDPSGGGVTKLSLEFRSFEEAETVLAAIVDTAVHFSSARVIAEFEAAAEKIADELEFARKGAEA